MIVELGVAALILSMLGKKTPKGTTIFQETAQEKMDRETREREAARVAAETSYKITADNAKTEADKKELERINAEIKKAEEERRIEDAKYFNFLAFGRDTTDPIAYKAMQTAYQNKSVAEGKLFITVTSITDPITKTVIPAGKEFKLAIGKYKSQQFAIPMVAFWGGRDNAIWLTYPVKNLMEVTYETSPTDKIKENSGPIVTTGQTGGSTTTYGGGGTYTTKKGSGVTGIKSPLIAGYHYGK
ncbi:hypothetical protein LBMAG19_6090 [Candidatus Pelagibacterales bacterium]|nr:hypothetical protein LBMAG19_6090 [Pelagibacterales bacterium]